MLNRRVLLGTAVELGVQQGLFSDFLLTEWAGSCLISVDPWLESDDYDDIANVPQEMHEQRYEETLSRLAKHGERSKVWRQTAAEASAAVAAESLDFIYLDARHDYASVKEEILTWYGKLRPGGIIAGHDYLDGDLPEGEFGVKSAVDEFFAEKHLRIAHTFQDRWPSWVVEKPKESERFSLVPRLAWNTGIAIQRTLIGQRRVRNWTRARLKNFRARRAIRRRRPG